MCSPTLD